VAIEKMKRVTAVLPAEGLGGFTQRLHGLSVLHVSSIEEELPEHFQPAAGESAEAREKAAKLEQVVSFCEIWGAGKRSFLESIFPAKTCASEDIIRRTAARIDAAELHERIGALRGEHDRLLQRLSALEKETDRLRVFATVDLPPARLTGLKHLKMLLVKASKPVVEEMQRSCPQTVAWEPLAGELHWLAHPPEDADAAAWMTSLGLSPEELPALEIPVAERMREIAAEREKLQAELATVEGQSREFAGPFVDYELALGFWQAELHRAEGLRKVLRSPRLGVVRGYLPARELEGFSAMVRADYQGEVLADDPHPGEPVPVKLTMSGFFRPVRLLVDMFGVPDYFSIDPTPFLTLTFLAFFGICFGDGVYGLMLIALALLLRRRFRLQENLRAFFNLFLYCGVSTLIFGALTGSWLSDLIGPQYLGADNFLVRLKAYIPTFDPLANPMMGLIIAIGIGVLNQFYGIFMLIVRNLRRADWQGAVFDGVLWYFYLGGLVILLAGMFAPLPPMLSRVGTYVLLVGAVGLVATQGRAESSIPGKIAQGVVSLYGIMGSYGATSFIGDSLSYSRLLALGLTTTIIGKAFNIIAGILGAVPYIGILLFIGVAGFGHIFNFFMSIIGSFVHPTRLILLEFFGRFYEAGGIRYQPFGFRTERVEVIRDGGR
jgi:V/A-type H+-transporting ATPase subunit I